MKFHREKSNSSNKGSWREEMGGEEMLNLLPERSFDFAGDDETE